MHNPDSKFEEYVKCPFYEESGSLFIRCEGLVPHSSLRSCFRNYNACRKFKTVHCASISGYASCPVSRALMEQKYPDRDTT